MVGHMVKGMEEESCLSRFAAGADREGLDLRSLVSFNRNFDSRKAVAGLDPEHFGAVVLRLQRHKTVISAMSLWWGWGGWGVGHNL